MSWQASCPLSRCGRDRRCKRRWFSNVGSASATVLPISRKLAGRTSPGFTSLMPASITPVTDEELAEHIPAEMRERLLTEEEVRELGSE